MAAVHRGMDRRRVHRYPGRRVRIRMRGVPTRSGGTGSACDQFGHGGVACSCLGVRAAWRVVTADRGFGHSAAGAAVAPAEFGGSDRLRQGPIVDFMIASPTEVVTIGV